ncbi:MAG: NUDIX hydrolase [Chloroflexi bacterium]|nr:NUDIX hydrolase [Chloroflexota bacterium]
MSPEQPPSAGYTYKYPRPMITVDLVLFTFVQQELRVLLIERGREPFAGTWALPGGFVEIDEELEVAAQRELWEETGVAKVYLEQLYTFGTPHRDPRGRVITVAYVGIVGADETHVIRAGDDARKAQWYNVYALPPLAFDHGHIIDYAVQRLRYKLEYTALGFLLLPELFTLSELQQVYEIVLQEKLDKRNFRRKVLSQGIIEKTEQLRYGDHRPARLYRFSAAAIELEKARRRFP